MQQAIMGFHQDEKGDWMARLACRHQQHMRHNPPWINRPWVITEQGREQALGLLIACKKCDENAPRDF